MKKSTETVAELVQELVQALGYAQHLLINPEGSSAAERAATMLYIDEVLERARGEK